MPEHDSYARTLPQDSLDTVDVSDAAHSGRAARSERAEHSGNVPSSGKVPKLAPDLNTTIVPEYQLDTADYAQGILERLASVKSGQAEARLTMGRCIGEGGMGVVRLANQWSVGRDVAVKTLRDPKPSDAVTMRLLQEAWVTGALEHPSVVPVYDVAVDERGNPVIMLKRIEGREWTQVMHRSTEFHAALGVGDLLRWNLRILIQVANVVHYAHRRGIVHRDIKPENVMLGAFGEVYLLDWGLAVCTRESAAGRLPLAKDADRLAGTLAYMAPEMLGREHGATGSIDERTDVYLLGATLYEILSGSPPHHGTTTKDVIRHIADSQFASRDSLRPLHVCWGAPAELVSICLKAMSRDPRDRYANAEQFRLALQGFLEHRQSTVLAEETGVRLATLRAMLHRVSSPQGGEVTREREAAIQRLQVYGLFSECRFGFRQALKEWPENPRAKEDLAHAVALMVEYELSRGDPEAASVLLSELQHPPRALVARVRALMQQHAHAEAYRKKLERIGEQHDAAVGEKTRLTFTLGVMTLFVVSPAISHVLMRGRETHRGLILYALTLLLLVSIGAYVGRRSLIKTAVNRRLVFTVFMVFASHFLLHSVTYQLGIPAATSYVLQFPIWFVLTCMVAAGIDTRLFPMAAGYGLASAFAAAFPSWRFLIAAAANAVTAVNVALVWGSRTCRFGLWRR